MLKYVDLKLQIQKMNALKYHNGGVMIIAILSIFVMTCVGSLITAYSYNFYISSLQIEKNTYWQENYNEIVLYEIEKLAEDVIKNIISKNTELKDEELSSKISSYLLNKKECENIKVEIKNEKNCIEISYRYKNKFNSESEISFCTIEYYKQGDTDGYYKILTAGKEKTK